MLALNLPEKLFVTYVQEEDYKKAFIVPSNKQKFIEKAKCWSGNDGVIIYNNPMDNIRILSIVNRMGSSVYKVLYDDYLVDMREDVILESIRSVGIKPGGVINGQFVWSFSRGQNMRLIRVGSEEHQLAVKIGNMSALDKIPNKKLEKGGVINSSQ